MALPNGGWGDAEYVGEVVADWVIDLGPEGGSAGGEIVATGTPEQIAANPASHTGHYLAPILGITPPQHVAANQ